MVSHKHKFVFIHIPKTAGTSIWSATKQKVEKITHNIRRKGYRYLKEYETENIDFSFAFVRNPWDRLVSAFKYLNAGGVYEGDRVDREKYLRNYGEAFSPFVKGLSSNNLIFNQMHFKPQYEWICDDNENILVDFIGKFENLQEDFNVVCDKIEIPRQKLPHSNKAKHKHYTEYYNDETRQIIAEKYAKDIEYFGYRFGD